MADHERENALLLPDATSIPGRRMENPVPVRPLMQCVGADVVEEGLSDLIPDAFPDGKARGQCRDRRPQRLLERASLFDLHDCRSDLEIQAVLQGERGGNIPRPREATSVASMMGLRPDLNSARTQSRSACCLKYR